MASVVFLRAANVGGHQVFRPSLLASQLAHLGVVNLGAAGTFVVPVRVSESVLRKEFARRLPFRTELMVCPGREVLDLVANDPFAAESRQPDLRFFVSVTAKSPRPRPALPLQKPEGEAWLVRLVGLHGRLFFGYWRRGPGAFPDPNTLVEKHVGMPATSRNWNTFVKLAQILGRPA
ncbi:MAG: hypothetical protein AB7O37_14645 [Vicinamibacteria bacterium]